MILTFLVELRNKKSFIQTVPFFSRLVGTKRKINYSVIVVPVGLHNHGLTRFALY